MKPNYHFNCIDDINLITIIEKTAANEYLEAANRHICECDYCLDRVVNLQKNYRIKSEYKEKNIQNLDTIRKIMGHPDKIKKIIPDKSDEIIVTEKCGYRDLKSHDTFKKGQIWATKYIVDIEEMNFYSTNPPYVLIVSEPIIRNDDIFLKVVVCRDYNVDFLINEEEEEIELFEIISFDDIYSDKLPFVFETWNTIEITADVLNKCYTFLSKDELNEVSNYLKYRSTLTLFKNGNNNIDFIYRNIEVESLDYLIKRTNYLKQKYNNENKEIIFDLKGYKNNLLSETHLVASAGSSSTPDFSDFKTLSKLFNENKFNYLIHKTDLLISVISCEKIKQKLISVVKELSEFLKANDIIKELKESTLETLNKLLHLD